MVTTVTAPMNLETLVAYLPDLTPNDRLLIERAYYKAEMAHAGQTRKSGEPYFTHCVAVAMILAEMRLDAEAIAAALMHDIIEDTDITFEDIRDEFSLTIARLVNGVTKLKNLPLNVDKDTHGKRSSSVNRELEYMRKMFLTMGDDVRVVLIKLADRLHNMRTLGYMKPDRQRQIARETMEIFAPLANRLGIWQIKWELEDLSLRYLDPDAYKAIATNIDERRADREAYMRGLAAKLRSELVKHGLEHVAISGRPKHINSIYSKMKRKGLPFEQIYDVRALRVIVDTKPQCYLVLGIVHSLWHPMPGEFDDYIAAPKDNFYQSLHTAVVDERGKIVEVQIRTWEMHEHAEYGIAAHWRYKEGGKAHDPDFEERLSYLRRLMEFGPGEVSDDAEAFVDTMKTEFFQDRVYVFTPKGDIVDLPAGATPIDFAYHIHTDVGHRCRGAKVHGRQVSLNHPLRTGDQIEILTSNRGGPSMDWLNEDLGYLKTQRARAKVKHYFRKLNRDKHIVLGREVLERELKKMGVLDSMSFETVAALFDYTVLEDFMAAVGAGDINAGRISNRVLDEDRRREEERQARSNDAQSLLKSRYYHQPSNGSRADSIKIMGTGGLLTNLAVCCNPMPGDAIIGYVTRGRGVTIHRQDCGNVQNIRDSERLIEVSWGTIEETQRFTVPVEIIAYDREGLIRDISTVIADEKINITDVRVTTRGDIATLRIVMEMATNNQLSRILSKITFVHSVVEAYRCNSN